MKIRRVISLLLMCAIVSQSLFSVSAAEIDSTVSDIVVVHDREKNDRINDLFALRGELELDFETNYELIAQIDQELNQLGVEKVSTVEIQNKLRDAELNIDFPSIDSTVQWTSRRVVTTYRGQQFELQIYEGIPATTNSTLIDDDGACVYEAKGITAGIANAMKIIAADTMYGLVSNVSASDNFKTGITVLDAFMSASEIYDGFKNALSTSTVFEDVSGTALMSFSVHMQYIFVKPYETPDYGNQLLSYIGSMTSYTLSTFSSVWIQGEVEPYTKHIPVTETGEAYSPYYDDYSEAAKNHYNYRYNGITDFHDSYYLKTLTYNIFGTNVTFTVPNAALF